MNLNKKLSDILDLNKIEVVKNPIEKAHGLPNECYLNNDYLEFEKEKIFKMSKEDEKLFGIEKLNVKRSEIPAVTHIDYTARVQTVHKETNKKYYDLISKFYKKKNCPVLINTSFNVRGEPIVNTPSDAFRCFMGTELDYLVIGNCFLDKKKQLEKLKINYKDKFNLD